MTLDRFRWVYCQLDNLRRCMPSSIRKSLDELPITLDETYERILQGIPKQKWQHAHRLFQCLVAAVRPLRVEELAEIFTIEFGSNVALSLVEGWRPEDPEEAVLSACSTLISIINDKGSKIVQFSHFSVKEFLTSDRLQTTDVENVRQYYIPLEPAHTLLAQACLTVLLQLDEKVDTKRLETFALAFYAAKHWVDHAKFQNVESQIQDTMERLFNPTKPHFRAWLWMHNECPWSSSSGFNTQSPLPPDLTPLYCAASCGLSGLAKRLIIAHAEDVNAKCCGETTPLHAASLKGYVDVAHVLFDHGAHINAQRDAHMTPLHNASWHGHPKVVQFLLEHGAIKDARDDYKCTPLYNASGNGHLEVVRLLLDHGADANIQGVSGTPFRVATRKGHHDVARLLQDHGASAQKVQNE
jgi:Ankyrin repeats (many copies)/Ankyrin repeats (3 copies)